MTVGELARMFNDERHIGAELTVIPLTHWRRELWMDEAGPDKKFYQGLIQAAVALCHFCNGNVRGATKLYHSAREYMMRYGSPFMGLDVEGFWQNMAACFAELLAAADPDRRIVPDEDLLPTLALAPPPEAWPDPAEFLPEEEGRPQ